MQFAPLISPDFAMSLFSQYLIQRQFCVSFEYLTTAKPQPVPTTFAGFPACITLADRVQTDTDPAPIDRMSTYPEQAEKILHYSGKGRDIADFERFLVTAQQQGIQNLLLLSGDKLKQHHDGAENLALRSRYLESVNQVIAAKQHGGFYLGVAFNPFKYAEAERDAQYYKLQKKIQAGANFVITQLGFDVEALSRSQQFMQLHYPRIPVIACVMPLTFARARFMKKQKVAGIVLTSSMLNFLENEQQFNAVQAEQNVYARCALQILICRHLGYAGIHLSACHKPEEQEKLQQAIVKYAGLSLAECRLRWDELWQTISTLDFQPEGANDHAAPREQVLKYKSMHMMHELFFSSKVAKGVGGLVFSSKIWNRPKADQALLSTEFITKHGIVGCESCGQCRLGETLYICPETCPKGLANGPCGGSSLDRCEFGDRECIHSVKARLAKSVGQVNVLKHELIPTVAIETRQTSSWKNWFSPKS